MKDIISSLKDPSHAYNREHQIVLKSLSEVKTVLLLPELPNCNPLISSLFTACFDVLSNPEDELSRNVEYHMTEILQYMVDECQALPMDIIEIIIAQFLRADPKAASKSNKGKKSTNVDAPQDSQPVLPFQHLPAPYNLAKNICNTCTERMIRYASHYFSNLILDANSGKGPSHPQSRARGQASTRMNDDDDDDEDPEGLSEEDVEQLDKAHRLLRELWRSCPSTLQMVIPQIEAELFAENEQIRRLATGAIGDLVAGVGAAGLVLRPDMNPAAYPPINLDESKGGLDAVQGPFAPMSPLSFVRTHPSTFQSFLGRRKDKSTTIRIVWITNIGRILATSAGGSGLDSQTEKALLDHLSLMLVDGDENVRFAAIQAVELLHLRDFVTKFSTLNETSESSSVLRNLYDRVKDRKPRVRAEAIRLLAKLWAVGLGELASGNEVVEQILGPVPSKIFDAYYVNDPEVHFLINQVLFETLLPIHYPILKKKDKFGPNQESSRGKDHLANGGIDAVQDVEKVRVERILLLLKGLDARAKPVFFLLLSQYAQLSPYMQAFLKRCEDFNGGVMSKDKKEIEQHLQRLIEHFAKSLRDAGRANDDLRKFAKAHDRRSYALIRFCLSSDSDYRKVQKSLKELQKRIANFPSPSAQVFETVNLLVCKTSNLYLNKSHIRPIIEFSQTDERSLGAAAHELVKHISAKHASVFKTHAEELCWSIEEEAPTSIKTNEPNALDTLKACSTFAKRFPDEILKERKFFQAMIQFALHGSPPKTAKHAISILMLAADKKQMYAKDVHHKCVDRFEYGCKGFLTRLCALGQLMLFEAAELESEDFMDPVMDIAMRQVLHSNQRLPNDEDAPWEESPDDECQAKLFALKILVNRMRNFEQRPEDDDSVKGLCKLLRNILESKGNIRNDHPLPEPHKAWFRLEAGLSYLKICAKKGFDNLLTPSDFNLVAALAQDSEPEVRVRFISKLKKLLGQDRLPSRFYSIIFLLAHEPTRSLKDDTLTWLRARSATLTKLKKPMLELSFARLLSLLAHHIQLSEEDDEPLKEAVGYFVFYLKSIATQSNISLIYYVAQRVKSVQDAIIPDASNHMYMLSDLAQGVIRQFEELHHWSMQAYSGRMHMPGDIFKSLKSHEEAQKIAEQNYLPEDIVEDLAKLVRDGLRGKKRKSEGEGELRWAKRRNVGGNEDRQRSDSIITTANLGTGKSRGKNTTLPVRKAGGSEWKRTPVKKRASRTKRGSFDVDSDEDVEGSRNVDKSSSVPESERRKSGRTSSMKKKNNYTETADSEDDELLEYVDQNQVQKKSSSAKKNEVVEIQDDDEVDEALEKDPTPNGDAQDSDLEMMDDIDEEKENTPMPGNGQEQDESQGDERQPSRVTKRNTAVNKKPSGGTKAKEKEKEKIQPARTEKSRAKTKKNAATATKGAASTRSTRRNVKVANEDDGMPIPDSSD